jgi:hypothetical protein
MSKIVVFVLSFFSSYCHMGKPLRILFVLAT